jgi:hypothetical protein
VREEQQTVAVEHGIVLEGEVLRAVLEQHQVAGKRAARVDPHMLMRPLS